MGCPPGSTQEFNFSTGSDPDDIVFHFRKWTNVDLYLLFVFPVCEDEMLMNWLWRDIIHRLLAKFIKDNSISQGRKANMECGL